MAFRTSVWKLCPSLDPVYLPKFWKVRNFQVPNEVHVTAASGVGRERLEKFWFWNFRNKLQNSVEFNYSDWKLTLYVTGKSMSEALIFALTNPQYDKRLFMKIENCKLRTSGEHDVYINCFFVFVLTFRTIFVHNMFSWCCELLKKIYL